MIIKIQEFESMMPSLRKLQEGNILGILVLQCCNRTKVLWRKYLTLILTLLLFLFCTSSTFNPNCGPKAYKDKFFLAFLQAAKRECDKIIDKNGPPPVGKERKKIVMGNDCKYLINLIIFFQIGTGIKQLRENIAESKLSYEIMDDAAQAFLKIKIMDNIQKYFYLIVFCAYLREQALSAVGGVSDDQKKDFSLTGGKGTEQIPNLSTQPIIVDFRILRAFASFGQFSTFLIFEGDMDISPHTYVTFNKS